MSLFILISIPLMGGLLAWYSERFNADLPKKIAVISLLMCWLPLIPLLNSMPFDTSALGTSQWLINESYSWIPLFNIRAHLALDGLSFLLIVLTLLMGLVALSSAWHEITKRTGLFYLNLLWTLAGVLGVFLAIDLFLFFVFLCVWLFALQLDHYRVKSSEEAEVSSSSLHTNLAHKRAHRITVLDDAHLSSSAMMASSLLLLSMI